MVVPFATVCRGGKDEGVTFIAPVDGKAEVHSSLTSSVIYAAPECWSEIYSRGRPSTTVLQSPPVGNQPYFPPQELRFNDSMSRVNVRLVVDSDKDDRVC